MAWDGTGSAISGSGIANIVIQLRAMTNCGTTDYTINGVSYWTDAQLQVVLDKHRTDVYQRELTAIDELFGGVYSYTHYSIGEIGRAHV